MSTEFERLLQEQLGKDFAELRSRPVPIRARYDRKALSAMPGPAGVFQHSRRTALIAGPLFVGISTAAAAAATGTDPGSLARNIAADVVTCKDELGAGEHGIELCVSTFAQQQRHPGPLALATTVAAMPAHVDATALPRAASRAPDGNQPATAEPHAVEVAAVMEHLPKEPPSVAPALQPPAQPIIVLRRAVAPAATAPGPSAAGPGQPSVSGAAGDGPDSARRAPAPMTDAPGQRNKPAANQSTANPNGQGAPASPAGGGQSASSSNGGSQPQASNSDGGGGQQTSSSPNGNQGTPSGPQNGSGPASSPNNGKGSAVEKVSAAVQRTVSNTAPTAQSTGATSTTQAAQPAVALSQISR